MSRPSSSKSQVPKKICLETLPPETLQLILLFLPDLPSLLCAALSSRTLYKCFHNNESILVSTILQHQIPASVLTSALASEAAARIKVICVETTREFFNTHLHPLPSSPQPPIPTRLRDALHISRLHFYIRSFSRGFASRTVAKQLRNRGDNEPDVSKKEMERIERAFYRFEIYNNLFRRKQSNPRHAPEAQIDTFFCAFSGWENEQLAAVHEFLASLIMPVFNNFATHDILWGTHGIEPAPNSSSEFIQALLSRGLASLHRLTRAKTYSQKHRVLYSPYPTYFTKFLYRGLEAYHLNVAFTGEKCDREFFVDSDGGPEAAWKWAQRGLTPLGREEVEDARQWMELEGVRSWGYVFWDRERLAAWGVLNEPFVPETERELSRWEITRRETEKEESVKRRSLIHIAGGSGYWDKDDESQVVWKAGKASPLDGLLKRKECEYCCGEVACAPHRLFLKFPPQKKSTMMEKGKQRDARTDDGCFLEMDPNLDLKAIDAGVARDGVGQRSMKGRGDFDAFRLSCMPTLLQTESTSVSGNGSARLSQMPTQLQARSASLNGGSISWNTGARGNHLHSTSTTTTMTTMTTTSALSGGASKDGTGTGTGFNVTSLLNSSFRLSTVGEFGAGNGNGDGEGGSVMGNMIGSSGLSVRDRRVGRESMSMMGGVREKGMGRDRLGSLKELEVGFGGG